VKRISRNCNRKRISGLPKKLGNESVIEKKRDEPRLNQSRVTDGRQGTMALQILKSNETLVVQVPASWTARDIRLEQSRVTRYMAKEQAHGKVILVGGGSEPQLITPLAQVGQIVDDARSGDEDLDEELVEA
jgi:hypothetical protein